MEATNNIKPRYTRGRPPSRDWEATKPEIELLIKAGYGCEALGKYYGLSDSGVRLVLKRLGLKTIWQEARDGQS